MNTDGPPPRGDLVHGKKGLTGGGQPFFGAMTISKVLGGLSGKNLQAGQKRPAVSDEGI
jgi:hypothetical protein